VESMLKILDGEGAVIGGLMQDEKDKTSQAVPAISKIPLLGNLFKYQDDSVKKSELVIFIRPRVIKSTDDLNPVESTLLGSHWRAQ